MLPVIFSFFIVRNPATLAEPGHNPKKSKLSFIQIQAARQQMAGPGKGLFQTGRYLRKKRIWTFRKKDATFS